MREVQRPTREAPRRRAVPGNQNRARRHLQDGQPQIVVRGQPFHERTDVIAVPADSCHQVRAGLERGHPLAKDCFWIDHKSVWLVGLPAQSTALTGRLYVQAFAGVSGEGTSPRLAVLMLSSLQLSLARRGSQPFFQCPERWFSQG